MAAFHQRRTLYKGSRRLAPEVAGKPAQDSRQAQGYGPRHAPLEPDRPFGLSETRGLYSVATFAGRPIVKWTRYGYYDEQGNLTMTRVI